MPAPRRSLDRRPPADLYRWSHGAAGAKEAVAILTHTPGATPGWERALDAIISADQRTRDSVWAMVANTFAPLADPAVLAAVSPTPDEAFDPTVFLTRKGTLYLLGTASGSSATATLVAARRLAAGSVGARLDPPLGLILDEAANYPLPSLPALMSEGGGSGITTLAVLQSLAQARDRWGREAAETIWDAAIAKIVLGGSANSDDLADISRLIGDCDVCEWSETISAGPGGRSTSTSVRQRPILEPSAIRRIPVGHGLLRSADPIMMTLSPWTSRPDARQLTSDRQAFEGPCSAGALRRPIPMRDPRAGLAWSRARVMRRAAYAEWMGSRDWLRWREQWRVQWVERHGVEPACAVCDAPWTLRGGDLHHRSYDRLGHEHPGDVTPMCRSCHHQLHRMLESGAWRHTTRARPPT